MINKICKNSFINWFIGTKLGKGYLSFTHDLEFTASEIHRLFFLLKPVAADFDVKAKVTEILEKGDFEKKRARTMDIDDFLG